jgi:3-deoxy-manno-octulosonate cytidylyltransferase (CMP-KDO synthetase)
MGSSRFPGKPLAPLCGRPMIEHVYRSAAACTALDEVVLATCDDEIADVARGFGARVAMTSAAHERASDRVAEATSNDPADIVVMIQGDEPMIRSEMISAALAPLLSDQSVLCTNLAADIRSEEELLDPNTIKIVTSRDGRALYLSRQPIPTRVGGTFATGDWLKQVCVIGFTHDGLRRFRALQPGRLEKAESIDMLRFVEHGIPVHVVRTEFLTYAVDTPADLARVERLMAEGHAAW